MSRAALTASLLLGIALAPGCPRAPSAVSGSRAPTPELDALGPQMDALAAALIDGRWTQGLVIGLLHGEERWVRGYGDAGDGAAPDGRTVFEIGSATKVFTALLAADAEARGELSLDWEIGALLPPDVAPLVHVEGPVRLRDLATHTSGLARMPANFAPADPADPYADYDAALLFGHLESVAPARAPGAAYEYSNLGMGLLGHLVARHLGIPYEDAVRARIAEPLGLASVAGSPSPESRAAIGHDGAGQPVPHWALDALAGAGDLVANADDLLTFLGAQLRPPAGALGSAIAATREDQRIAGPPRLGLAWHLGLGADAADPLAWHNGQTGGFHSFIGFDAARGFGVVLLANQAEPAIDGAAAHVIRLLRGEESALGLPTTVAVDPAQLQRLVGVYVLSPFAVVTVRVDGQSVFVQLTGQPELPVFARSDTEFAYRAVQALLTFEIAPGAASASTLVLDQGGRTLRADRYEPRP